MRIGCPKEIKSQEFRVGLIPAAVKAYVESGHQVSVEKERRPRIGDNRSGIRAGGSAHFSDGPGGLGKFADDRQGEGTPCRGV